jgi:small subunit ribosomal protein S20
MANTKSAQKEIRKTKRRTARNKANRSALRTAVKKFRALLAAKDFEKAASALPAVASLLDKSAKRGIIHHRNAARAKSRLSTALNRARGAA